MGCLPDCHAVSQTRALCDHGGAERPHRFSHHFPYTQVAADGTWPEYDAVCTYKEQSENMLQDDPDFPFYLTTGRVAHYHHTTLRTAPYSRELIPVPDMRINPRDAAALGVADGDWVELRAVAVPRAAAPTSPRACVPAWR